MRNVTLANKADAARGCGVGVLLSLALWLTAALVMLRCCV
jgi:hypothetical protein